MSDLTPKPPSAVCATHGLRYNNELESGCVLCRRQREPAAGAGSSLRHLPFLIAVCLLVGSGVFLTRTVRNAREAAAVAAEAGADLPTPSTTAQIGLSSPTPGPTTPTQAPEPITDRLEAAAAGNPRDAELTSMYAAAELGSGRAIKRMLAQGADINELEDSARSLNTTPLAVAVKHDRAALALWLIREGADVKRGEMIIQATLKRMPLVVEALLDKGADANTATADPLRFKDRPIQIAVDNADVESAEALTRHGARLDVIDHIGQTLLTRSAASPHERAVHMVQWLIDHGESPTAADKQQPVDPNVYIENDSFTPLRQAALRGKADVVRLLVLNGARANLSRWDGFRSQPLLAEAASTRKPMPGGEPAQREVIHTLIELGADPRTAASYMRACQRCNDYRPWAEEAYIRQSAERPGYVSFTSVVDDGGNTHLHWAAALGEPSLIKRLVERDLDYNKLSQGPGKLARQYDAGATPLHLAAAYGHVAAVATLLASGARNDRVDTLGRSPKDVVCKMPGIERYRYNFTAEPVDRCQRVHAVLSGEPVAP